MRTPSNYIVVKKEGLAAIGRYNLQKIAHGEVLVAPDVKYNYDEVVNSIEKGEIVVLKEKWTKYRELEEDKIYLVPVEDVLLIFDKDEIMEPEELTEDK